MNILLRSFAAAGIAAIITGTGQNPASASERSAVEFAQIGRGDGAIILAEKETKSNARGERVILHGYDPKSFDKMGFTYCIHRPKKESQHFAVSSKYVQIAQHPSLWATTKLVR